MEPPSTPAPRKPAPGRPSARKPAPKVTPGGGFTGPAPEENEAPARSEQYAFAGVASKRRSGAPKPPKIQKFVFEEDRGSPVLLIALGGIIALAAGVILYSFKIL